MRTSGVLAGGGALGLGGGRVRADQTDEHYLVASDFHWGSPFSNESRSRQFLEEEVPARDPDVLVLSGDIYELWFRGMLSSAVDAGPGTAQISAIHGSGTDVVLVAGNHDRWLLRVGLDAAEDIAPGQPWTVGEEYYFESGDQEFVAVHGDEGDPTQRDPLSAWLSLQTDAFGSFLLELYELVTGIDRAVVGETGTATLDGPGSRSVALTHQYDDPVVVPGVLATGDPAVPRVATDTRTGTGDFEVGLVPWRDADPDATRVDYVAFERGQHAFGADTTVAVDRTTVGPEWTTVTFGVPFDATPAVFPAVQGSPSGDSVPPRLDPAGRSGRRRAGTRRAVQPPDGGGRAAPVSVQVRNVTALGCELRLVSPDGGAPLPRDVGVLALESGTSTLGADTVDVGIATATDDGTVPVPFDDPLGRPRQVFAAPQTATDGGPAVTRLSTPADGATTVSLETPDGVPVTGTVASLATGDVGPLRASASSAVESDPQTLLQAEWAAMLGADYLVAPEDTPEVAPATSVLDPLFVEHASTTDNLLDMYEAFVVFGHTHRPDLGERHVNNGSWTSRSPESVPENTYTEIVDGDVTVWDWSPDGREPLLEQ